jgi:Trypsin
MKVFILLACLASVLAFEVDYENVVPIYETAEWQAQHPDLAKLVIAKQNAQIIESSRNGRIVGGSSRNADAGELPYQVGIVVLLSRQAFCGGSIVSNNFVLSAASCFPG